VATETGLAENTASAVSDSEDATHRTSISSVPITQDIPYKNHDLSNYCYIILKTNITADEVGHQTRGIKEGTD
jgi:hypothetical protein